MTEPNVGSVVSYLQGPRSGLPGYVAVPGITRPGPPPHNLFVAGWLGEAYLPFAVGGEPSEPDFTKNLAEKSDNPPAQVEENLRPEPLVFPEGLDAARLARRAGLRCSARAGAAPGRAPGAARRDGAALPGGLPPARRARGPPRVRPGRGAGRRPRRLRTHQARRPLPAGAAAGRGRGPVRARRLRLRPRLRQPLGQPRRAESSASRTSARWPSAAITWRAWTAPSPP